MDENILKIVFFVTDILTAGGRRPLYTLFIDKENDCFIGYDYRLKKWTNKMLDKIELPKGVKGDHTWCDLNSPPVKYGKPWVRNIKKIMYVMAFFILKNRYGKGKRYRNI